MPRATIGRTSVSLVATRKWHAPLPTHTPALQRRSKMTTATPTVSNHSMATGCFTGRLRWKHAPCPSSKTMRICLAGKNCRCPPTGKCMVTAKPSTPTRCIPSTGRSSPISPRPSLSKNIHATSVRIGLQPPQPAPSVPMSATSTFQPIGRSNVLRSTSPACKAR